MLLKELPIYERPRERAIKYGIENLSNSELLSILLRTGNKDENVISLANTIFKEISTLNELKQLSIEELTKIKGIGPTKAITILASVELGTRILKEQVDEIKLTSANEVYQFMLPRVQGKTEENLFAIYLNAKGSLIACKLLTTGNVNSTIIDAKLIFKWAYKLSATGIILVHNHPSGDPTPSMQDLKYTERIIKQSSLTEFVIVDHIIIGNGYYSIKKNNKLFKVF